MISENVTDERRIRTILQGELQESGTEFLGAVIFLKKEEQGITARHAMSDRLIQSKNTLNYVSGGKKK